MLLLVKFWKSFEIAGTFFSAGEELLIFISNTILIFMANKLLIQ